MITSYSFDKDVDNLISTMITSYSFDKEVYVDNLKISNYDYQITLLTKVYVDNLKISNYDYQLLF